MNERLTPSLLAFSIRLVLDVTLPYDEIALFDAKASIERMQWLATIRQNNTRKHHL